MGFFFRGGGRLCVFIDQPPSVMMHPIRPGCLAFGSAREAKAQSILQSLFRTILSSMFPYHNKQASTRRRGWRRRHRRHPARKLLTVGARSRLPFSNDDPAELKDWKFLSAAFYRRGRCLNEGTFLGGRWFAGQDKRLLLLSWSSPGRNKSILGSV